METAPFSLTRPYQLSSAQVAQYRHDGHILLRDVVPPEEIDRYRPMIKSLVERGAKSREIETATGETRPLFVQASNLWRKSEAVRELVFAERFARLAAELMGVKGVRLYHDRALIKEPGGYRTPWHKDHYNWPLATHHTVKMWLALVDISLEMGRMQFVTGTHHSALFPEVCLSYDSEELFERILRDRKIPIVSYTMRAGDATFHWGETLHSAMANNSPLRREVLAITYFADGTRVMEPDHQHRRLDLEEFLPGLKGGDLAASELNPLLYRVPEAD
jgi:ectoine hydroxylase-related dioxygenase (phytanoyl-CoA dioxygenase family)